MTKPVVGVAIQMLADDGKLSIDDPVAKHLPAFDTDKSRAITIRQLLTHTSGLPAGRDIWRIAQTPLAAGLEGFTTSHDDLIRYFDNNTYYRRPHITGPVRW